MAKKLSDAETLIFLDRFHGHIGPYVVLGYRAGLVANRELGEDPFCKRARTFTGLEPPVSCFTDGVQFGSCCTLGKGNITVSGEGEPRVRFELKDGSKSVEISLTERTKARIAAAHGWETADRLGRQMLSEPEGSLFVVRFPPFTPTR